MVQYTIFELVGGFLSEIELEFPEGTVLSQELILAALRERGVAFEEQRLFIRESEEDQFSTFSRFIFVQKAEKTVYLIQISPITHQLLGSCFY